MRFLSVCSGIEAASQAWHPLGWEAVAFSEIEPFPCAILKHHYPTVPNWGDMTKFKEWPHVPVDLLCGGTPCQSFSVAGLRNGMDDPRGNLALVFLGIAHRFRPKWVVWENVPGVLSSRGGRDFGSFLGGLGELGYGWSYRVLDAQHFGVPQRRRRVFVVGHLGDWRRAAAVLFERESLSWDSTPRRESREGTSEPTARSLAIRGRDGISSAELGDDKANAILTPSGGRAGIGVGAILAGTMVSRERGGGGGGPEQGDGAFNGYLHVAHSLRADGFDASEDGTGRGTPLVADSLRSHPRPGSNSVGAIAFQTKQSSTSQGPSADEIAPSLDVAKAGGMAVKNGSSVRRLTPRECERLQGFKDDYTFIPQGKKMAADGPRYKALGNSMAVPVMRWIGERIQMVEDLVISPTVKSS